MQNLNQQQKRGKNKMKIYEIGFDYANYDVIFTFKINKDASFFFSKEELDRYFRKDRFYEEANLKRYVEW